MLYSTNVRMIQHFHYLHFPKQLQQNKHKHCFHGAISHFVDVSANPTCLYHNRIEEMSAAQLDIL